MWERETAQQGPAVQQRGDEGPSRTAGPGAAPPPPPAAPVAGLRPQAEAVAPLVSHWSEGGTQPAAPAQAQPAPGTDAEARGPVARTVMGVQIVGPSASKKAVDECASFVTALIGKNKLAQKQLAKEKVTLVIVPHDKNMTDLPQFAALKGTKTFDGRLWDKVRGSGGMRAPDGSWAIAVPEENLSQIKDVADGYGAGYSVGMHEFAHTLHEKGLTGAQKKKISELYKARKKAGGPWTEAYGASNEHEYYAQATNCYFGKNKGVGNNGKEWLKTNDPAMFEFLEDLYGQRYDEQGNVEHGMGDFPGPGADDARVG